jgi:hypothetical protein
MLKLSRARQLSRPNPSRGAANCAPTQELPGILRNPKVHYRVYKIPPLVPIPSQINPIYTIQSYLSKINFKYCSPTYCLFLPVVSSPPFVLHSPPISSSLT